jgi:hypothetical protein
MADSEDPGALARRFLDLWQEQVAAAAADPALAEMMRRLAESQAAWAALWTAAGPSAQHGRPDDVPAPAPVPPHGAAPAGDASGGGGDAVRLAERLAALEARIAALEAVGGGRSGARRGARPRRS